MAVIVAVDSVFVASQGGYYAYVIKFSSSDNLDSLLNKIGGLKVANVCATKKEADKLVNSWNDSFKENGMYAY